MVTRSLSQMTPETYKCSKQNTITVQVPRAISTIAIQGQTRPRLFSWRRCSRRPRRNLSVSYNKVGDVIKMEGNLDGPFQAYHHDVAIRERLAATPASPERRDLLRADDVIE